MATTKSTQQNNDWFSSQQQYWDTWFESQRKAFSEQWQTTSPQTGFQGQWAEFFKEWQNTVSGSQPKSNTEAFQQHFAKAGETFLNMTQQFYQATGQAKPLDQMAQEWTEQLKKFYASASQETSSLFDIRDPFTAFDPLGAFTTIPALGYTREKQEQLNDIYNKWAEYRRKSRAYDAGMAKVGLEAVQKFQEYLSNPPQDQEPITSLKGIYAKWVDICEEIYARYAMSDEYARLYGESVNALMAFKKLQNKMIDDMVGQLNLPTRQEVDSLHERSHALRRDNIQLKKDIAELKAAIKPKSPPQPKASAKPKHAAKKGKK